LDEERRRVEIHRVVDVRPREARCEPVEVDFGVTETMKDSEGARLGEGKGKILATYSDKVYDKGRKKRRMRAIQERHEKKGKKKKARRIGNYNLGDKKRRSSSMSIER
jgi:hypothetical protein